MEKEKYIQKVWSSSRHFKSIEVSDSVWSNIQAAIGKTRIVTFTPKQVMALAASLLLLISLNISLLASTNKETTNTEMSLLKKQLGETSQDNIYGEL